jgi:hypothetical protein
MSASGCDSIVETTLTVELLDLSVTNNNGVLSSNASGASYQWVDCDNLTTISGETNQSFEPTGSGNYSVEITQNGCAEMSDCYEVQVSGLASLKDNIDIEIYPNPSKGTIVINSLRHGEIQIVDMKGKLIRKINLDSGKNHLVVNAASGIYTWKFETDNGDVTFGKLVIDKH